MLLSMGSWIPSCSFGLGSTDNVAGFEFEVGAVSRPKGRLPS